MLSFRLKKQTRKNEEDRTFKQSTIDLRLSIIFCLSSGDIYLSLSVSLSFSELFCCKFFETFVIFLIFLYYNIILILVPQYIYLSLGISSSCSFAAVSELFFLNFETFVILLAILLPIKSLVAYAVFWIALFEAVLNALVADCSAWSRRFWLY